MRVFTLCTVLVGIAWFLSASASSGDGNSMGGVGAVTPGAESRARITAGQGREPSPTPDTEFAVPIGGSDEPSALSSASPVDLAADTQAFAATQDPRPGKPEKSDKPAKASLTRAGIAMLTEDLQGAWRLVNYEAPTLESKDRQQVGFLLVAGSYFSFEMHLGWTTPNGTVLESTFVSGTHRFEVDENSRIVASSVIGAGLDDDGKVAFEVPGRVRRYEATCTGNQLTLLREDGTKLSFERIADSRVKRDAYGRPLKLKDPNAKPEDGDAKKEPPR